MSRRDYEPRGPWRAFPLLIDGAERGKPHLWILRWRDEREQQKQESLLKAQYTKADAKRRAKVIDHVAAGYILQGFLDRIAFLERARA